LESAYFGQFEARGPLKLRIVIDKEDCFRHLESGESIAVLLALGLEASRLRFHLGWARRACLSCLNFTTGLLRNAGGEASVLISVSPHENASRITVGVIIEF